MVTEFEFALQRVGPIVYAGMVLHPRAAAPKLMRFYRDFMDAAPDEINGGISLMTAPPEEFVPEEARGAPAVALLILYAGDPAEGEAAFRPLVEWGEPWLRAVQPMPYVAVQQMLDPAHPWGINDYSKSDYLPELTDEAIDALVDKMSEVGSPFTGVHFCQIGGAAGRVDRDSMALEPPQAKWFYMCEAMWMDPAHAESEAAWAGSLGQALRPWTTGKSLPNFISADDGHARLRASYGEDKFERLIALKDEYDPDNVFALNQNIPPTVRT